MKFNHFTRALPALALGCTLIAGPALAQSTMAPVSSAPMAPAAPAATSMSKPATTTHKATLPAADKFKTAALATSHCPGDTVVWATSSSSKVLHTSSSKYYGKTKSGAFVCEKEATAAGYHVSKD